jgi:hypothetical protein
MDRPKLRWNSILKELWLVSVDSLTLVSYKIRCSALINLTPNFLV